MRDRKLQEIHGSSSSHVVSVATNLAAIWSTIATNGMMLVYVLPFGPIDPRRPSGPFSAASVEAHRPVRGRKEERERQGARSTARGYYGMAAL